ncbi:MAG: hypothetical protein NTY38_28770, partial [Acidobacteria bacterium]|nr:hypothetical protein [Acidobacteriota bacterium]
MSERDAGISGDAERRGYARNHFEGDAGGRERFHLLAAAAEDEGIAALEADDGLPLARLFDQHGGDLLLRKCVRGALLAHVDALG